MEQMEASDKLEQLLELIGRLSTPGFFITAEVSGEGNQMPQKIVDFVDEKMALIHAGSQVRKFVFREEGWRIVCTFFPTDQVVDERYALKNKVFREERCK